MQGEAALFNDVKAVQVDGSVKVGGRELPAITHPVTPLPPHLSLLLSLVETGAS